MSFFGIGRKSSNLEEYIKAKTWFENIYFTKVLNGDEEHFENHAKNAGKKIKPGLKETVYINTTDIDRIHLTDIGKSFNTYNLAIQNESITSYRDALIKLYRNLYRNWKLHYMISFESQIDNYKNIFEELIRSGSKNLSRTIEEAKEALVAIDKYKKEKKSEHPNHEFLSSLLFIIKSPIDTRFTDNILYEATLPPDENIPSNSENTAIIPILTKLKDVVDNEYAIFVVVCEAVNVRQDENLYTLKYNPYVAPITKSENEFHAYNAYLEADKKLTNTIVMMAACKEYLEYRVKIVLSKLRHAINIIASDDTIKHIRDNQQKANKAVESAFIDLNRLKNDIEKYYRELRNKVEKYNRELKKPETKSSYLNLRPNLSIFTSSKQNTNTWEAMKEESDRYANYFEKYASEKQDALRKINRFEDAKFEYFKYVRIRSMLDNQYRKIISEHESAKKIDEELSDIAMNRTQTSYSQSDHLYNGMGGNKQKTKKKHIRRRPTKKQYSKIKKSRRTFHNTRHCKNNTRHCKHNTRHRKNRKYMTGGAKLTKDEIEQIKEDVTKEQLAINEMKDIINRANEIWIQSTEKDVMLENSICEYVKQEYDNALIKWKQAKADLVAAGGDTVDAGAAAEPAAAEPAAAEPAAAEPAAAEPAAEAAEAEAAEAEPAAAPAEVIEPRLVKGGRAGKRKSMKRR
jgi:hypothetical protein